MGVSLRLIKTISTHILGSMKVKVDTLSELYTALKELELHVDAVFITEMNHRTKISIFLVIETFT